MVNIFFKQFFNKLINKLLNNSIIFRLHLIIFANRCFAHCFSSIFVVFYYIIRIDQLFLIIVYFIIYHLSLYIIVYIFINHCYVCLQLLYDRIALFYIKKMIVVLYFKKSAHLFSPLVVE